MITRSKQENMERINSIQRAVKIALASLLVVTMLALGGLAATNAGADAGISTLISAARTATQQVTAENTAQVKNPTTTTTTRQAAPAQQQQNGVIDARNADRVAGPAVVTVVNTMQQT